MSVKNCIEIFRNSLNSIQTALEKVVLKQMPAVKIDVQTGSNSKMKLTLHFQIATIDTTKNFLQISRGNWKSIITGKPRR